MLIVEDRMSEVHLQNHSRRTVNLCVHRAFNHPHLAATTTLKHTLTLQPQSLSPSLRGFMTMGGVCLTLLFGLLCFK